MQQLFLWIYTVWQQTHTSRVSFDIRSFFRPGWFLQIFSDNTNLMNSDYFRSLTYPFGEPNANNGR